MYLSLQITSKIANFIIDGNIAYNAIQLKSFHELLEAVARRKIRVPSYRKLTKNVSDTFDSLKKKLVAVLKEQDYICITADVWSARAQSYLGVTVHYLSDDYDRKSFMLALRQIRTKQTYDVLAESMIKILDDFEINVDKVTNIVTDGGSAFCKAFKEFGVVVTEDTMEHELTSSEDCNDLLEDESCAEATPFFQFIDGGGFYSNTFDLNEYSSPTNRNSSSADFPGSSQLGGVNFEDMEDDELELLGLKDPMNELFEEPRSEKTYKLPQQRRCVSHILNLLSHDFERKLSGPSKKCLISTANVLQPLWVRCKRSAYAKGICKETLGIVLTIPCVTRWNSKYDSMKKVFDCGITKINELITRLNVDKIDLTKFGAVEWGVLSAYLLVMGPIARSLDQLQGESQASQGYIIPTLHSMRYHVSILEGSNIVMAFKNTMLSAIDERCSSLMEISESNKELILAATSIPLFKTNFIMDNFSEEYARTLIRSEMIRISVHNQQIESSTANETTETRHEFFVYSSNRVHRRSSIEDMILAELQRYLNDDRTSIDILNEYPNVKKIYMRYNTTLSASAAVERIFSQALMIFAPRRNRLNDDLFEKTLFMKINREKLKIFQSLKGTWGFHIHIFELLLPIDESVDAENINKNGQNCFRIIHIGKFVFLFR